jgi:hypothetical protein
MRLAAQLRLAVTTFSSCLNASPRFRVLVEEMAHA